MTNIISQANLYNGINVSKEEIEGLLKDDSKKVYEVIRIINSKPIFLQEHVNRLCKSIKLLGLNKTYDYDEIFNMIKLMTKINNIENNNIRITYYFNKKDILLLYFIKSKYPNKELYEEGVKTVIVNDIRVNPNAKIEEKNKRKNINIKIKENNAFEAILVNDKNLISEGSRSNIFFIKEDYVITPKDKKVLLGVTRDKIINLCNLNNIKVYKRDVSLDEIGNFDGAFITGTSINVLPIKQIDNHYFSSSKNKLINKISDLYVNELN